MRNSNEISNSNKDVENGLNNYSELILKSTNGLIDEAYKINKLYLDSIDKESRTIRIATLACNTKNNTIETGQEKLIGIQTNVKEKDRKINTIISEEENSEQAMIIETNPNNIDKNLTENMEQSKEENAADEIIPTKRKKGEISKRLSNSLIGIKLINKVANTAIKTGKTISTGVNDKEGSIKSFEMAANKWNRKSLQHFSKKIGKPIKKKTTNILVKMMRLVIDLMEKFIKVILSFLPSMFPIIIIIIIIACFLSYFGLGMQDGVKKHYENYMIKVQEEYDNETFEFYQTGGIVEGGIEGKGMIQWKAPLAIIQMLNTDLVFDNVEKSILDSFKKANLFELVEDIKYTYEKETEVIGKDGKVEKKNETIESTKKRIINSGLQDYIEWCNQNFDVINRFKREKNIDYDINQKQFTEDEIEQIKMLYKSNTFFGLFSEEYQQRYAYNFVDIDDEKIQTIYDEFLKNVGKRYLMDHSNLSYDTCMEYYDCSSWVIHVLAHTNIKTIPNTRGNWNI